MPDRDNNNPHSELPTPRSNPHGDTSDGDTEIPQVSREYPTALAIRIRMRTLNRTTSADLTNS